MRRWRLEIEIALYKFRRRTILVRAEDHIPDVAPKPGRWKRQRRKDTMFLPRSNAYVRAPGMVVSVDPSNGMLDPFQDTERPRNPLYRQVPELM